MKIFIIMFCILAVSLANSEWDSFKLKYARKYSNPSEESYRKKIFLSNKMSIDRHNQRFMEGKTTFTMGINQFADMTNQEFNGKMNKYITREADTSHAQAFPAQLNAASVDWRASGCVTGVKDEGQAGCSWAFALTGTTEFANCRAKGTLVACSEQNLLDCSWAYGNMCCESGSLESGLQYIVDHGIDNELSYPYSVNKCQPLNCPNQNSTQCTLSSFQNVVPYGSESALETAVATIGPVATAIDGSHVSFQLYSSGVYDEPLCSSTQCDHGVLVVGYGVDGDQPYWLVKNDWGEGWGINGYIEMSKDKNNQCGIATAPSYGIY